MFDCLPSNSLLLYPCLESFSAWSRGRTSCRRLTWWSFTWVVGLRLYNS